MSIVFTSRLPVASGGPDMKTKTQARSLSTSSVHTLRTTNPTPKILVFPHKTCNFFSLIKNNNLQVII
jgi:hypothetical protein